MMIQLRSKLWSLIEFENDQSERACPPPNYERYDPMTMKQPFSDDTTITLADEPNSPISIEQTDTSSSPSWLSIAAYSLLAIALICLFLFVLRGYVKYLLLSLENTDLWVAFLVFGLLFTVVSFPLTWGYILLNIAAGYLYGLWWGMAVVMVCAVFGLSTAHLIQRRLFVPCIVRRLASNDSLSALLKVIDSGHGFRIVVLARLTPIPFGLQNGLFAVSKISTSRYLLASVFGMFPSQGMHAYIGSTLRSMEEVVSDSGGSATAYTIFILQIIMAIGLLTFVIRLAKKELNKAVATFGDNCVPTYSESTSKPEDPDSSAASSGSEYIVAVTKRHSPSNSYGGTANNSVFVA